MLHWDARLLLLYAQNIAHPAKSACPVPRNAMRHLQQFMCVCLCRYLAKVCACMVHITPARVPCTRDAAVKVGYNLRHNHMTFFQIQVLTCIWDHVHVTSL